MQRAAVELKALGNTLRQTAEALDVSVQNAGVLVHRGRKRLRKALGAALPGGLR
jgi:DNA-directed RNA polymerase specialized sigma24 family protein